MSPSRQSVRRWNFGDDPGVVLEVLRAGGVVGIPTESSYGLAVDVGNPEGVARVFELKGRSGDKPLPVVVASVEAMPPGCRVRTCLESRLASLWPSALTLVLELDDPRRPPAAAAGRPTLAVRVPAHRRLRELLTVTGPLTATSANRAGKAPLCEPDQVRELLSTTRTPSLLVDDGPLAGGPPSTLVRVEAGGWRLLRRGAVEEATLEAAAGAPARHDLARSSTGFVENSADE